MSLWPMGFVDHVLFHLTDWSMVHVVRDFWVTLPTRKSTLKAFKADLHHTAV